MISGNTCCVTNVDSEVCVSYSVYTGVEIFQLHSGSQLAIVLWSETEP